MSEVACPYCGRVNDCHDAADPAARPKAGDVAVCRGCRAVVVFVSPSEQRRPTAAELAELMAEPDVRRALAACAESYTPHQAVELTRGAS